MIDIYKNIGGKIGGGALCLHESSYMWTVEDEDGHGFAFWKGDTRDLVKALREFADVMEREIQNEGR